MVSQDSPPHPSSNILHQSHFSDSITNQNQFETQHFDDAYGSTYRNSVSFPQSLGLLPSIQSLEERMSRSVDLVQAPRVAGESEMSNTRHLIDLFGTPNHSNHPTQRLSLSLGSDMLVPSVHYTHRSFNSNLVCPNYLNSSEDQSREACNQVLERVSDNYSYPGSAVASSSNALNRTSFTLYGKESLANAIGKSRFLKPAQSLLEEIVSVGGKAVELSNEKYVVKLTRGGRRGSMSLASELKAELCSTGLISVEKHELQVKIANLIALLEEVEGRFEKYYHQMQGVMSSFEMIAGSGSAKSYTALALQAMSRHFCSLRDSIVSQIKLEKRKQISDFPKISTGLSQLSLFDKDSRHNRTTLQQLGLMQSQRQHQVWRPIRGLPENSVSILRAWLFEHFLHPYPNDSEKLMLASQTGLTKNQVSNWFINARVRLWKPMIEEMYKEEFGDSSEDSNPLAGGNIENEED